MSSETTVAKHRSYLQKGRGVTPKVPTEGKLIDNNNAQGHNFKHKIGEGAKSEARTASMKGGGGWVREKRERKLTTLN